MRHKSHAAFQVAIYALVISLGPANSLAADDDNGVVVSATRSERRNLDIPGSIDVIGAATLRDGQHKVNLSESLSRVPGLNIQNRQNYAQDLQLSIRGFGFRSNFGTRGVKLYADGIPATMPDGQGQTSSFNLSSAQRIEVMRGPLASLYGNSPGGVIQLFTEDGPARPTVNAELMSGAYGTRRLGGGFGGQSGPINYIADWSQFHTDGWRDHSSANREQFNTKIKWQASADTRISLVLGSINQPDAQDPLGLTRVQAADNPRQVDAVAIRFNTRKTNRQEQLGTTIDKRIDSGNTLRFSAYGGDRQVLQYQAIPVATGASLNTYSGGVVDLQRYFGGGSVNWIHDSNLFGKPFSTTVGVEQEMMQDRRRGFDNNSGTIGTLRRDEDNRIEGINTFIQADWRFAERMSASIGLRNTRVNVRLKDYFIKGTNGDDSGQLVFANTSPVAGLAYRLAPELSLYGSVGRGFETPTFTELAYRNGSTGMNTELKPGRNTNYEIGLKGRIGTDHRVTLAHFETQTRDEIITDTSVGGRSIFKNASKTQRSGWEAGWQAAFPAGFDSHLAYTVIDAKYTEAFVSGTSSAVAAGNRIPGVPRTSVFGELRWQHLPSGFSTSLEARHASQVIVDDQNSDAAAAYTITNLRFGLEQKAKDWRVTQTLRIDNMANVNYIGSVIVADSNSRFFETAPRRGVSVLINGKLNF